MVPLKNLNGFWRALEMPLISCEINHQLKWSANCFLVAGTAVAGTAANQEPTFRITDTKLYVLV